MHGRHKFFLAALLIIQAAFPLHSYSQDIIRIEAEDYTAMNVSVHFTAFYPA